MRRIFKSKRMGVALLAALLVLAALPVSFMLASAAQADGEGYTIINTAAELDAIRNNLSGKYRLYSDIDLTGYTSTTSTAAKGWKPIAYGSSFTGELDGNGHAIKGLWSKWGISYAGLFSVTKGATIRNLAIMLADAGITGGYEVGAVTGDARNGTLIQNVTVIGGKIAVTAGGYAGGIAGFVYGSPAVIIRNCSVLGTTTKTSGNYSGALVGVLDDAAIIEHSRADGTLSEGLSYVGGLVGAIKGGSKVIGSFSTGEAKASASYAGGLAGVVYEKSSIIESKVEGNVSANAYAGGLVGTIYGGSKLDQVGACGNATTKSYIAGGLAGEVIDATISNAYAHGNVKGTTGVGGLVGYFSGTGSATGKSVENSYSAGTVTGTGSTEYGAFNGRSGVRYLGTNFYNGSASGAPRAYGTSGSPKGDASAFPVSRTSDELSTQATFAGWNFDEIWAINEGSGYPYLAYDKPAPSPTPEATPTPTATLTPTATPISTASPTPTATPTIDPVADSDNDGLPDYLEEQYGTDPSDDDSDDDGILDGDEVKNGLNPLANDADDDSDSDGISNIEEVNTHGTNPLSADSDDDGLTDEEEINNYHTNPMSADSDDDGLTDEEEINNYKTDPLDRDTDGDMASDGWEAKNDSKPLAFDIAFFINGELPSNNELIQRIRYYATFTSGEEIEQFRIEQIENEYLNDAMPGYLTPAIKTYPETRGGSSVRIYYDFEDPDIASQMNVYEWNEEDKTLEFFSTQISAKEVRVIDSLGKTFVLLEKDKAPTPSPTPYPLVTEFDSDGDGASDEFEISIKTDPNVYDEYFVVSGSMKIDGCFIYYSSGEFMTGEQAESLRMDFVENDVLNSSNPDYIIPAIKITANGKRSKVGLEFIFDNALDYRPVLYKWDGQALSDKYYATFWLMRPAENSKIPQNPIYQIYTGDTVVLLKK
ncbi:MAG: hypothetical protein LBT59_09905 [Clostridiales bacterium]|jgi:hypothetical protein|nr:hypothetical protein [Clostridiales bacterium]